MVNTCDQIDRQENVMASENSSTAGEAAAAAKPSPSQKAESDESNRSGRSGKKSIDEMLTALHLREDEEEDIVLEEDPIELAAKARWLALARVYTPKTFSHGALYGDMRAAWNLAKEVEFRAIEDNLFSMQFNCLADWERVMFGGPWIFRGSPVLMAEYDGWADTDSVELNEYPAWVHVLDLREKMRTGSIAKQLSKRAGTYISIDELSIKGAGEGIRVRVKIDARKPIARVASITLNNKKMYFRFQYEKMPDICGVCGLVGHVLKECGDGVWPEEKIIYPPSLIVPGFRRDANWMQSGGRGGRGAARGRGRSQGGRGDVHRQYTKSTYADEDDDLKSTASSPSKNRGGHTAVGKSKRRLDVGDGQGDPSIKGQLLLMDKAHVDETTMQTEEELAENDSRSAGSRDSKRAKKVDGENQLNDLAISAGSFEEHRRA
jgi:hypothetical protein